MSTKIIQGRSHWWGGGGGGGAGGPMAHHFNFKPKTVQQFQFQTLGIFPLTGVQKLLEN